MLFALFMSWLCVNFGLLYGKLIADFLMLRGKNGQLYEICEVCEVCEMDKIKTKSTPSRGHPPSGSQLHDRPS